MGTKNINASESAEHKNINETAYRDWKLLSDADLGKTKGGFFTIHATTEAIAVAKAISTISSTTELEILGV